VIHLVLRAFLAARVADLCAKLADLLRELRAARHFARRKRADIRATTVELDTADHHFHVLFVQASGRAVLASFHALVTRFDTIFIFFVRHILCGLMPPQPVVV
jgi:DNA-binding GntR family transcriptional regulator